MVSELAAVRDRGWSVQSSVPLEGTPAMILLRSTAPS